MECSGEVRCPFTHQNLIEIKTRKKAAGSETRQLFYDVLIVANLLRGHDKVL